MNNYFSMHTVKTVFEHLPEKLAASAGITGILSALDIHAQLVGIFFLLELLDVFIAPELSEDALTSLAEDGIHTVICPDGVIRCTDPAAELTDLYRPE